MRGSFNGIWLTPKEGSLHPQIIFNLSLLISQVSSYKFSVVLWTNLADIKDSEISKLKAAKVTVKDYSECGDSMFYNYFLFFLELGKKGDVAAFALASDILRMSILELAPNEDFVIYADPNDIQFFKLDQYIGELEERFYINSFGFSFTARYSATDKNTFETRNDLLIALKKINEQFFSDYFLYYQDHLENYYKNMKTC